MRVTDDHVVGSEDQYGDSGHGHIAPMTSELLTVPEVANILRLGRTYTWRLVRDNKLTSVHFGRRVFVPRRAVDVYIATQTRTADNV